MEKEYGSIYKHYTKECYYYDLLDLFRRLLLTGGLIMVGEDSIVQTFLGILVCCGWLYLVVRNQPYRARLDNLMATILNSHLLLTLICGMALKLYDATPQKDAYEQTGFAILIVAVTIVCNLLGLSSGILGTSCGQQLVEKYDKANAKAANASKEKAKLSAISPNGVSTKSKYYEDYFLFFSPSHRQSFHECMGAFLHQIPLKKNHCQRFYNFKANHGRLRGTESVACSPASR